MINKVHDAMERRHATTKKRYGTIVANTRNSPQISITLFKINRLIGFNIFFDPERPYRTNDLQENHSYLKGIYTYTFIIGLVSVDYKLVYSHFI